MAETIEQSTPIETKIAEYSVTTAALAELRKRFSNVAFDLTTTKGDKEARAARLELVRLRTTLEAKRKELKAPALERSRLIDEEAKRITAAIVELEKPIDEQIIAAEHKRETERQAKIEAEQRRVAHIRARIDDIKSVVVRAVGKPSAEIEAKINLLVGMTIGDSYQELKAEAERAHAEALVAVRELYATALVQEDDARRIAEERAALQRRQAEQAETERIERERVAAEQRAAQARIDEQRAALERQEREARERREEEDRRAAAAREQADQEARERREAEEQRMATERAALRRDQEERDRKEREAREAEERYQREAAEDEERRQAEMRAEQRRQEEAAAIADKRVRDAAPQLLVQLQSAVSWVSSLTDWAGAGDPPIEGWQAAITAAGVKVENAKTETTTNEKD